MKENSMDRLITINDFKNYAVSENGIVFSLNYNKTGKCKAIRSYLDKYGYEYVILFKNKKRHKRLVHRLVLQAFVSNPENKPQANHLNGVRNDNRLCNLEWCTAKENVIHSYKVLGKKPTDEQVRNFKERFAGSKNPKAKMTQELADNMRVDRKNGMYYKDICKKYGISASQVSAIIKNKFWKSTVHENKDLLKGE